MKRFIIATIIATTATGCATVPLASQSETSAAKRFETSVGSAGIYVMRDSMFGAALKKTVYVDGTTIGSTAPNSFLFFRVKEGVHVLATESEFSENFLNVNVEHGKNYFVRQTIKMGVFVGGAKLTEISEVEGKSAIQSLKLAAPSAPIYLQKLDKLNLGKLDVAQPVKSIKPVVSNNMQSGRYGMYTN